MLHLPDLDSKFLARHSPNGYFRCVVVEQTGCGFDQHSVGVCVDVSGAAELLRQQDGAPFGVVQQDCRAVAAVVGFALLRLESSVPRRYVKVLRRNRCQPSEVTTTRSTLTFGLPCSPKPVWSRPVGHGCLGCRRSRVLQFRQGYQFVVASSLGFLRRVF